MTTSGEKKPRQPSSSSSDTSLLDYLFFVLIALAAIIIAVPDTDAILQAPAAFYNKFLGPYLGGSKGIVTSNSGGVAHVSPRSVDLSRSEPIPTFVYYHDKARCQQSSAGNHLCATLQNTYEEFASHATSDNLSVHIMSVDCQKYEKECTEAGITSFPSLVWYRHGEAVDVKNPVLKPNMDWNAVTPDALYEYAKKKIDQGHCNLHNLVGEGAMKMEVGIGKERQLPAVPSEEEEEEEEAEEYTLPSDGG